MPDDDALDPNLDRRLRSALEAVAAPADGAGVPASVARRVARHRRRVRSATATVVVVVVVGGIAGASLSSVGRPRRPDRVSAAAPAATAPSNPPGRGGFERTFRALLSSPRSPTVPHRCQCPLYGDRQLLRSSATGRQRPRPRRGVHRPRECAAVRTGRGARSLLRLHDAGQLQWARRLRRAAVGVRVAAADSGARLRCLDAAHFRRGPRVDKPSGRGSLPALHRPAPPGLQRVDGQAGRLMRTPNHAEPPRRGAPSPGSSPRRHRPEDVAGQRRMARTTSRRPRDGCCRRIDHGGVPSLR